jgi:mRNA interferase RelE/StbE
MVDVSWRADAQQRLSTLDPVAEEHIRDRLGAATDWPDHYLEPLAGQPYHKLRAGKYRAIISWHRDRERLVVETVGHRRSVYDRNLPR